MGTDFQNVRGKLGSWHCFIIRVAIGSRFQPNTDIDSGLREFERELPGLVRRASSEGDVFEYSLNVEESHYKLGFNEGYKDGVNAGEVDGRDVGLKNGFQVSEESWFYTGCVDIWKAAVAVYSIAFSPRAERNLTQFEESLLGYPHCDQEDERVQELLENIQVKV